MSLYLSESNTERLILQQIYHGLSEAYFNLNEHEKSIDAGNEYFKMRPIKSEVIFFQVLSFSFFVTSLCCNDGRNRFNEFVIEGGAVTLVVGEHNA